MSGLAGKVILVVDDEEELRELLKDEFEYHQCKVFEAGNIKQALQIISQESVDVVISDVRMPGGDGVTLLKEIKNINPQKPVVFLITGFADTTEEEALQLGAAGFIHKPFEFSEVIKNVEKAIGV